MKIGRQSHDFRRNYIGSPRNFIMEVHKLINLFPLKAKSIKNITLN